jgi:hypothetical protein
MYMLIARQRLGKNIPKHTRSIMGHTSKRTNKQALLKTEFDDFRGGRAEEL